MQILLFLVTFVAFLAFNANALLVSDYLVTNSYATTTGALSNCIGGTASLSLSYTQGLSGTLPSYFFTYCQLYVISVNWQAPFAAQGNISGMIPTEIALMTRLTSLNLSLNKLSGTIPTAILSIPYISLNLSLNKLTGPIPSFTDSSTLILTPQDLCVPTGGSAAGGVVRQCAPQPAVWSSWSTCDAPCGNPSGVFPTRVCIEAKDGHATRCADLTGSTTNPVECVSQTCGDVNGSWTLWSPCDATCNVSGNQYRYCTSPVPRGNGSYCAGPSTQACTGACPPIDGGWTEYPSSSLFCFAGQSLTVVRSCDNPAPSNGGKECDEPTNAKTAGDKTGTISCKGFDVNGGWSTWGICDKPCGGVQTRYCNNPAPERFGKRCKDSSGADALKETKSCGALSPVCGVGPIHGGWTVYGGCTYSGTPGCGSTGVKTRTCTDPVPSPGTTSAVAETCRGSPSISCTCEMKEFTSDVDYCAECPFVNAWSTYGACSVSCGEGGTESRQCTDVTCPTCCPGSATRSCAGPVCLTEQPFLETTSGVVVSLMAGGVVFGGLIFFCMQRLKEIDENINAQTGMNASMSVGAMKASGMMDHSAGLGAINSGVPKMGGHQRGSSISRSLSKVGKDMKRALKSAIGKGGDILEYNERRNHSFSESEKKRKKLEQNDDSYRNYDNQVDKEMYQRNGSDDDDEESSDGEADSLDGGDGRDIIVNQMNYNLPGMNRQQSMPSQYDPNQYGNNNMGQQYAQQQQYGSQSQPPRPPPQGGQFGQHGQQFY